MSNIQNSSDLIFFAEKLLNLNLVRKLLELGGMQLILLSVISRSVFELSYRMLHTCLLTL